SAVYFFFVISMLAAIGFIAGVIMIHVQKVENWPDENIPEVWLGTAVFMMGFCLFFPWFTALYFARWFLRTTKENEERIAALEQQLADQKH
ncbi:MAG: hypothetical protein JSW47_07460, partial [Phycisphaerales bacterium]